MQRSWSGLLSHNPLIWKPEMFFKIFHSDDLWVQLVNLSTTKVTSTGNREYFKSSIHSEVDFSVKVFYVERCWLTKKNKQKSKKFELGKWDKANRHYFMLECLFFVCLFEVLCQTREFFTRMVTSPLPVKGFKYVQRYTTLTAFEQWGLFNAPNLQW